MFHNCTNNHHRIIECLYMQKKWLFNMKVNEQTIKQQEKTFEQDLEYDEHSQRIWDSIFGNLDEFKQVY